MNAIKFLLNEHENVRKMLGKILNEAYRHTTKRKMFASLGITLAHHEKMEQKIWYPYLIKKTTLSTLIKHLISEEKTAAATIKQIKKITPEDEWENAFMHFKDSVEHHAREEEIKLFPKVEGILDDIDLEELGKKMKKFKKDLDSAVQK